MKLKGRKAILLLGMPVGFALAGALVYMQFASASPAPAKVPEPSPGQSGMMLPLEERVINLAPGGTYKYLKLGVTVEMRPESAGFYSLKGEARKTVEDEAIKGWGASMPLLFDKLGQAVAAKTSDELASTGGRAALKTELIVAFREVLGEEGVLSVYFTDFVMQ
jgi:flagellar FliL protein